MKSYNIKCKGCGIYLNDDPNSLGYVKNFDPEKTKYCKRCFNIKHYNKCETTVGYIDEINNTLNDLVLDQYNIFIVLDVLDIQNSLIEKYKNHQNVFYIINKMDLLPKNHHRQVTEKHIIKTIEELGYDFESIIFCSTKSNTSIKNIDSIIKTSNNKNIFIGKSNVGKSSLIKKLCEINKVKNNIVVSNFLNTTNNLNKIKLNKWIIIDSPGFINEHSILNFIDQKAVKKIQYQNIKRVKNFQVYENRVFKINNLASILVEPNNKTNITFYIDDKIEVTSSKFKNDNLALSKVLNGINYLNDTKISLKSFNIKNTFDKTNLAISGLGIISFKNIKQITVLIAEDVNVNILNYSII